MTSDAILSPYRAQFGEDRVLERVFGYQKTGYYIEVGAYDGVTLSNSYFFEQVGWRGILVEPIPDLCLRAAPVRPNSRIVHAACGRPDQRGSAKFTVAQGVPVLSFLKHDPAHAQRCLDEGATLIEIDVPVVTLDDIIAAERKQPHRGHGPWVPNVGWCIDFVSIDVEGAELDVLEGFHLERYRPKVLVIENERAAGAAIEAYLTGRGYRKFHRQQINDFYVRDGVTLPGLQTLAGSQRTRTRVDNTPSGGMSGGISGGMATLAWPWAERRLVHAHASVGMPPGVDSPVENRCHTGAGHTGAGHTGAGHTGAGHTSSNHAGADHAGAGDTGTDRTGWTIASGDLDGLLVLVNPGDFTRHYMIDMARAAERLGIRTLLYEIGPVWVERPAGRAPDGAKFLRRLREHRIGAVLSSSMNGSWEWPMMLDVAGVRRPFFEEMGIPLLLWWTDHPQWAVNKAGLTPRMQPFLNSPNNHHFVKSVLAADELREMLGWPHAHGLPVAEGPNTLKPVAMGDGHAGPPGESQLVLDTRGQVTPEFDVVAIVGSRPRLDPKIAPFLEQDDPDVAAITTIVADDVRRRLTDVWVKHASETEPTPGRDIHVARNSLERLGQAWVDARLSQPGSGAFRLFQAIEPDHTEAAAWLRAHPPAYFDAVEALWEFGHWQRTFVLAYLARHFRVGVFGGDWTSVGLGKTRRVLHVDQPAVYARGRIALNVSQGNDEESITHKPFQIAASGVAMLHMDQPGLAECFAPGSEIETFRTPREACEKVADLLSDPDRRGQLADNARRRLLRDHTWEQRLPQMLAAAGVRLGGGKTQNYLETPRHAGATRVPVGVG